jgi:biotin carboxyl carrier protein
MEFKNFRTEKASLKLYHSKKLRMNQFKYTINDSIYQVTITKVEDAIAEVEVNGISYKVLMDRPMKKQTISCKRPAQALTTVSSPTPVGHPADSTSMYIVRSPLPGSILSIDCQVGDEVKKGQNLLILEAMKMENSITADHNGIVTEIKVKQGDSVMENADLVVIQ